MSKIPELAVKYAQVTNQALGVAVKMAAAVQQEKQAAAKQIPAVVELLKQAGWIDEHQATAAADQLGNHAETLAILQNCIKRATEEVKVANAKVASATLGAPATDNRSTPVAGNVKNANYTGRRRGDDEPLAESDRALAAGLGIQLGR